MNTLPLLRLSSSSLSLRASILLQREREFVPLECRSSHSYWPTLLRSVASRLFTAPAESSHWEHNVKCERSRIPHPARQGGTWSIEGWDEDSSYNRLYWNLAGIPILPPFHWEVSEGAISERLPHDSDHVCPPASKTVSHPGIRGGGKVPARKPRYQPFPYRPLPEDAAHELLRACVTALSGNGPLEIVKIKDGHGRYSPQFGGAIGKEAWDTWDFACSQTLEFCAKWLGMLPAHRGSRKRGTRRKLQFTMAPGGVDNRDCPVVISTRFDPRTGESLTLTLTVGLAISRAIRKYRQLVQRDSRTKSVAVAYDLAATQMTPSDQAYLNERLAKLGGSVSALRDALRKAGSKQARRIIRGVIGEVAEAGRGARPGKLSKREASRQGERQTARATQGERN